MINLNIDAEEGVIDTNGAIKKFLAVAAVAVTIFAFFSGWGVFLVFSK